MRLDQALRTAAGRLSVAGVSSPAVDARLIAAHLLGCAPMEVFAFDEEPAGFWELVARRELREPLQHILGVAPFGPLELEVGPGVFIPRPETETLADWAVRALGGIDKPLVVDLCTGSGALALYVAHYVPQVRVIGVELSDAALAYAERNARGSGVQLVQGDVTDPGLLAQLQGNVDLVVTNPPYVPEAPDLDREVYQDPHEAVFAGPDGMSVIDAMVPVIAGLLRPGGIVGIEHDDAASAQVQQALAGCGGFTDIAALKDLAGVDRFVTARRGE